MHTKIRGPARQQPLRSQNSSVMLKRPRVTINGYTLVSQEPNVISPADLTISGEQWLPNLLAFWVALESFSGFRWKCTSYIRNSPTHRKGQAIDLAPDFTPGAAAQYAVGRNSDPVLYKREQLIRLLQALKNIPLPSASSRVGVFIEPDHLHVQVLVPDSCESNVVTVKWKVPKPVYPDTLERMKLPMFT